jgi:hypothetical protein
MLVTFSAVALNSVRWHGNAWYVSATGAALLEGAVVTALVTVVIEGRRKRAIRRTLELAFLNHHVRNAITQMSMLQHIADPVLQERYVRESVERISEVLFRIANSRDLTGLSLEVDLQGLQLTHQGAAREQEDMKKAG